MPNAKRQNTDSIDPPVTTHRKERDRQRRRQDPYEARKGLLASLAWLARLFVLLVVLTTFVTAALFLLTRFRAAQQGNVIEIDAGDPSLSQAERVYLQLYLTSRVNALNAPAGQNESPIQFIIDGGERADQIAANLAAAGLLTDTTLFLNYLRFYGLDSKLEAGVFQIGPSLTIPELATTLTRAVAEEIVLRFLEGWRLEEMAAYLNEVGAAQIDGTEFLAITRREVPFDLSGYDFLASLPAGSSLEGYLFPDTYRVPVDADAPYLVNLMLITFGERVTPAMRQQFGAQGLTVRDAVTLASIVERETPLPGERPLVAGVFLNRLNSGIKLEADPTVQYAVGFQPASGSWWKSPLFQTDLEFDSPYNSYLYPGLPPGPIANPSLTSLQAVAAPEETSFIFFVADCSGNNPGGHQFSITYEEHLAKVNACR